jgi:uncharacterized membrane protein
MDNSATFCPNCGAANTPASGASGASGGGFQQNAQNAFRNLNNTGEYTEQFDPADINNNKGMSILSYFGLLFLIPLLAAPQSKFARYHVNQGIVLLIAEAIIGVASGIVAGILLIVPFVGPVISGLIYLAVSVVSLVWFITGIVNCVNGRAKDLPIIGKYRILK